MNIYTKLNSIIKKYFGEVILIGGIGILFYNVFNFSHNAYYQKGILLMKNRELEGIAYYYHSDTLLMIAIGVMLITTGILIIKKRK